jgi:uncharacterized repeat protein (TIGR03803 family)
MTLDGAITRVNGDLGFHLTRSSMIQASDGNFYLPKSNFSNDVVRMTTDGDVTLVHTFVASEGSGPRGLMQAADGCLYGTTRLNGGDRSRGTAFRMTLDGDVTVLHRFSDEEYWEPNDAPIQARDGHLYGTTSSGGGPGKQGIVYRLALP